MTSRYVRDEILSQGIELSASPTVIAHDMPGGVIDGNAYSIKWLQNALDMFHRKYPFASDIHTAAMTIQGSNADVLLASPNTLLPGDSIYLPDNFILDVRNGLICTIGTQSYRLKRKSFQYWLNYSLSFQTLTQASTTAYCIVNEKIKVAPLLTEPVSATLYYYALPALLGPKSHVPFPDEFVLIEFIRLKALEWTRSLEPGTSQMYLTKQLAGLRASGLLNEPEYEDGIPLENNQVLNDGTAFSRTAWMER